MPVKVSPIQTGDELKTKICYVLKNPTKARMAMFYNYPWGTGNLYFSNAKTDDPDNGMKVKDLGLNESRSVFQSRKKPPEDWTLADGLILPANYVPVSEVESLFKTPRSFMYFLSLNKDDEIDQEDSDGSNMRLTDTELREERNIESVEEEIMFCLFLASVHINCI